MDFLWWKGTEIVSRSKLLLQFPHPISEQESLSDYLQTRLEFFRMGVHGSWQGMGRVKIGWSNAFLVKQNTSSRIPLPQVYITFFPLFIVVLNSCLPPSYSLSLGYDACLSPLLSPSSRLDLAWGAPKATYIHWLTQEGIKAQVRSHISAS